MTPVLCFPYAGAGASAYRRLAEQDSTVRICPVQLPGREERYGEPLPATVGQMVDDLMPTLLDHVDGADRVALFGHSLGAVIAYEAAFRFVEIGGPAVARLFVSGSPGPWTRRANRATGLSDAQFLDRVRELAGYAHPALSHPDLRDMLLPILRGDVALHENYVPPGDKRLAVPVTTIRGADDDLVSAEEAAQWTDATSAGCVAVEVPGGHMYLVDTPAALVRVLEEGC